MDADDSKKDGATTPGSDANSGSTTTLTAIPAPAILPEAEVPALAQVPVPAAALPAVASPVVEAVDMDLVDGDGKQQFTVEIRSLVDSICDKTGSVLSLFR